ncbi:hypothetical protein HY494_02945 [Candidatus Woesearchaeota archaeon]|nr:hypothetical protein [Candidatus Woesearchaeota archaeon]
MKHITAITDTFREVYSEKIYFLFSGLFSLFVFSFNAAIRNYKLLFSEFSLSLFLNLIIGVPSTMSPTSLSFLVIISLLSGIVFSLSLFLLWRQITYSAGIGLSGIITSILTPACSSCALGLAGILGISGFLSVLPFKGLELGALGILLLMVSIVYQSNKIALKVCDVKK